MARRGSASDKQSVRDGHPAFEERARRRDAPTWGHSQVGRSPLGSAVVRRRRMENHLAATGPGPRMGAGTAAGHSLRYEQLFTSGTVALLGPLNVVNTVNSSASNDLSLNANGANRDVIIKINATEMSRFVGATPALQIVNQTAIPAGGTAGVGLTVSSATNFGVFFGSGAPTLSAAKGSLYLRSDGSGTGDRAYINTNGSTTWTAITTAA